MSSVPISCAHFVRVSREATDREAEGIIIDSREKSEQAWKNALRAVRRPEDLDGFD